MSHREQNTPQLRKLLLVGTASYLTFLIAQTPASVLRNILPADNGIQLHGLQGTLWQGQAARVRIQQHTLESVHWDLQGWKLLLAQLSAELSAKWMAGAHAQPVHTQASLSVLGALRLSDTVAQLDATSLGQLAQIPLAQLGGRIDIRLDHVEMARDRVPHASGIIHWREATVSVTETVSLGEVSIRVDESDTAALLADISNLGGGIKLDGSASVQDNGDYQLQLNMKPLPGSSTNVRGSLKMFARELNDGSFQLDNNGNLAQFGLM